MVPRWLRMPRDVASVRAVARKRSPGWRPRVRARAERWQAHRLAIAHLDPQGARIVLPKRPGDVFFGPKVGGVWEYRCLLRMLDGAIEVGSLRRPAPPEDCPFSAGFPLLQGIHRK
jgi:hypothetical protein